MRIQARRIAGQALELTVSDDGVGMDQDPFLSAQTQKEGKRRLSGIGLANVKSRLLSIYGEPYGIVIESEPGRGTTCTIQVPVGVNVSAKSIHRG